MRDVAVCVYFVSLDMIIYICTALPHVMDHGTQSSFFLSGIRTYHKCDESIWAKRNTSKPVNENHRKFKPEFD